ncbi:MAG: hypothetical protein B0D85_05930 [Candidatus Sedimenticola endophacoides]|uniref:Acyl-[ACP]--phospholipid O-acyltransferase n=1 Tax=Candidatus Sedimenticola endophacoides TaxID=2548426 RepID=A0A657PNX4_9GAMM|nr:MAG: hypothetical protein B0D84_01665 [Candidatus Sedimenticola endophacoides]OQX45231.1 MAG: hypothetical protein B0D85_05930 [Candidatus Sedimenticola endophacoides]OQX46072.1 MAG: hypothetical protein B0D86_02290 [Candidatus Sedimenticola endophacoides]
MEPIRQPAAYLPFLLIVFFNAFVDLGHKIVIQNTLFKLYDGETQVLLIALVNALILLPFVLLFSPAGFLADRYRKPRVMRHAAAAALLLTLLITFAYYQGLFGLAFFLTLLLGVQSALYSPAKYGYIKELLGVGRLAGANAMVQAVTIVAILGGVFLFSLLFEWRLAGVTPDEAGAMLRQVAPLGWLLVVCSLAEWLLTFRLGPGVVGDAGERFEWRRYVGGRYLRRNLRTLRDNRVIWLSIIGLSVFWGVSQVVLAAFPAYAKEVLGEESVLRVQGVLASTP